MPELEQLQEAARKAAEAAAAAELARAQDEASLRAILATFPERVQRDVERRLAAAQEQGRLNEQVAELNLTLGAQHARREVLAQVNAEAERLGLADDESIQRGIREFGQDVRDAVRAAEQLDPRPRAEIGTSAQVGGEPVESEIFHRTRSSPKSQTHSTDAPSSPPTIVQPLQMLAAGDITAEELIEAGFDPGEVAEAASFIESLSDDDRQVFAEFGARGLAADALLERQESTERAISEFLGSGGWTEATERSLAAQGVLGAETPAEIAAQADIGRAEGELGASRTVERFPDPHAALAGGVSPELLTAAGYSFVDVQLARSFVEQLPPDQRDVLTRSGVQGLEAWREDARQAFEATHTLTADGQWVPHGFISDLPPQARELVEVKGAGALEQIDALPAPQRFKELQANGFLPPDARFVGEVNGQIRYTAGSMRAEDVAALSGEELRLTHLTMFPDRGGVASDANRLEHRIRPGEIDEHAALRTDIAQSLGAANTGSLTEALKHTGLAMIPVYGTMRYWNQMSVPWRAVSVASDALIVGGPLRALAKLPAAVRATRVKGGSFWTANRIRPAESVSVRERIITETEDLYEFARAPADIKASAVKVVEAELDYADDYYKAQRAIDQFSNVGDSTRTPRALLENAIGDAERSREALIDAAQAYEARMVRNPLLNADSGAPPGVTQPLAGADRSLATQIVEQTERMVVGELTAPPSSVVNLERAIGHNQDAIRDLVNVLDARHGGEVRPAIIDNVAEQSRDLILNVSRLEDELAELGIADRAKMERLTDALNTAGIDPQITRTHLHELAEITGARVTRTALSIRMLTNSIELLGEVAKRLPALGITEERVGLIVRPVPPSQLDAAKGAILEARAHLIARRDVIVNRATVVAGEAEFLSNTALATRVGAPPSAPPMVRTGEVAVSPMIATGVAGEVTASGGLSPEAAQADAPVAELAPAQAPKIAPAQAPVIAPAQAPEIAPAQAPKIAPAQAPVIAPAQAPEIAPAQAPEIAPAQAPKIAPAQAPVIAPAQAPEIAPAQAPEIAPAQAPKIAPAQAPVIAPAQAPEIAPAQAPEIAPAQAPKIAPAQAPVIAPAQAPEIAPAQAPEIAPAQAPKIAPAQAPVIAPAQAPVIAPAQAPEIAPAQAPEIAPTPAPTPEPVPEPEPAPSGEKAAPPKVAAKAPSKSARRPLGKRAPSRPRRRPGGKGSPRPLGAFPATTRHLSGTFEVTTDFNTGKAIFKAVDNSRGVTPAQSFRVLEWDNDPPSQRTLERGIVNAVLSADGISYRRRRGRA